MLANLRKYVQPRRRILAGALVLAVASLVALSRLPDRSEASIAALLGDATRTAVATEDFVWAPSEGAWSDLVKGRAVVFLGRSDASPRDVYRARVRLTPGGSPLFAGDVRRITETPVADEEALAIIGPRAFFFSRFREQVQSVGVVDLSGEEVRRAALVAPAASVSIEPAEDALVLSLPEGPAVLPWTDAGAGKPTSALVRWAPEGSVGSGEPTSSTTSANREPASPEVFPPAGATALLGSEQPLAFRSDDAYGTVFALDGRQLELHLLDGARTPGTQTGFISDGSIPTAFLERRIAIAIAMPSAPNGGSFKPGGWASPIKKGQPAIGVTRAGDLLVGQWPNELWEAPDLESANGLVDSGTGQWVVCATSEGHLLIGSGPSIAPDDARFASCAVVVSGKGEASLAGIEGDGTDWASKRFDGVTLVGLRARYGPTVTLPDGEWAPLALGQPSPAWLPAIRQARVRALGEEVTVSWIDVTRFDWTIRAGEDERSHRLGGDFPEVLAPADAARARIAIGLGVGKRRSPRGLRIDGSTGHRFHGSEGVLLVEAGALAVLGPDRPVTEPRRDGTELPVSVDDGALTSAARERGPRQARQDLCVIGTEALLAEATFDSHEATAQVLRDLGCKVALALDRGADREGWLVTERAGPFRSSAVIGLDRPLKGRARAMPPAAGE